MNTSKTILIVSLILAGCGWLWADAQKTADEDYFVPNLSLAGIYADVHGDEGKFREHFQKPAQFSGGLEAFSWNGESKEGIRFEVDGRALYDADHGMNLKLTKADFGSIRLKFDTYRRFYDSTVSFYPYAPFLYDLTRDLYTDRGEFGFEVVLAPPDKPKFTFGYERKTKEGNQNLPWGGWLRQAPPGNDWILWQIPLYRELDYASDRVYFAGEHTLAGWHIRLRQEWERFDGTQDHMEPGFYTSGTNVFTRTYQNIFDHTTWTTSLDVSKDLIKDKLILDAGYMYQDTVNDNVSDADARTAGSTNAIHYGEHSINFNDNTHSGGLSRHTVKGSLTWDAMEDLTLSGGAQYRYGITDNLGRRNEEGSGATAGDNNNATSEEQWTFNADTIESTWMENLKIAFSQIPKTRLTLGADFEQSNVDYDWNAAIVTAGLPGESVTGQGDWMWEAQTDYRKYSYWINIRTEPVRFLAANLKYKYKYVTADVNEDTDTATLKPGDPEYEPTATTDMFYPGRIEGWRRPTHDARLSFDIKPVTRITLRPVIEYELTEYHFKDELDGSQDIAEFNRWGYGGAVDLVLASRTFLTISYMRQDITTETDAKNKTSSDGIDPFTGLPNAGYFGALVDEFDGSYDTLSGVLTHSWQKFTLRLNGGMTNGEGNWETHYYWGGLGADYRINKHVTANLGYTHYRYDEDNNGNINNYYASVFLVGVRARF